MMFWGPACPRKTVSSFVFGFSDSTWLCEDLVNRSKGLKLDFPAHVGLVGQQGNEKDDTSVTNNLSCGKDGALGTGQTSIKPDSDSSATALKILTTGSWSSG